MMKKYMNRRSLGLLGLLLASQMLSACIILPRPFHHRHITAEPASGEHGDRRGGHGERQGSHRR